MIYKSNTISQYDLFAQNYRKMIIVIEGYC